MLSEAPTRANSRSTTGSFAVRAGTNEPACAMRQSSAVCRRYVDFPPMFGPVRITSWCVAPSSATSFGTNASATYRSTTGWRTSVARSSSPACIRGHPAAHCLEDFDLALENPFVRPEHLLLVRFQIGGDEPFPSGDGLL